MTRIAPASTPAPSIGDQMLRLIGVTGVRVGAGVAVETAVGAGVGVAVIVGRESGVAVCSDAGDAVDGSGGEDAGAALGDAG